MGLARRLLLALPLALPVALAACGGPPPPPILDLNIYGGKDQNPNPAGAAVPVQVFLYQLASPTKFEGSDVFALTERGQATLGADLLASENLVIAPGEVKNINKEVKAGTQALGVVVLFRDIDRATWRATAKVAKYGPTGLNLTIKGLVATLAPQ